MSTTSSADTDESLVAMTTISTPRWSKEKQQISYSMLWCFIGPMLLLKEIYTAIWIISDVLILHHSSNLIHKDDYSSSPLSSSSISSEKYTLENELLIHSWVHYYSHSPNGVMPIQPWNKISLQPLYLNYLHHLN